MTGRVLSVAYYMFLEAKMKNNHDRRRTVTQQLYTITNITYRHHLTCSLIAGQ